MPISRSFKTFHVLLVISTLMVSLFTLNGYCDDKWVLAARNDNNVIYYDSDSVKIDKQKKIINVSTKWTFTDKGKIGFSANIKDDDKLKSKDIDYSIILYTFNYKEWKCNITNITEYTKSGKKLYSNKSTHEWKKIAPNSIIGLLLNKIIQQYNIER